MFKDIFKKIIHKEYNKLEELYNSDVIIIGTEISGLVTAYYLSKLGYKVSVIDDDFRNEQKFCIVNKDFEKFLKEINVGYDDIHEGYFLIDNFELILKLISCLIDSGVNIFLGLSVKEVIFEGKRLVGIVVHYNDKPIEIYSKIFIDSTGRDPKLISIIESCEKDLIKKKGSRNINVEDSYSIVEYTGKVLEGLYVVGLSVAELYGLPKPGVDITPILLSGKRLSEIIYEELK